MVPELNVGKYASVDFLIGTEQLVRREGTIFAVGASYLILRNPTDQEYIVCDFYSIKFTTFYEPNSRNETAAKTRSNYTQNRRTR